MVASEAAVGCSALLRMAGLPVRFWLAGANPPLFEMVGHLARDEEARLSLAESLADRIGQQLVPNPRLARNDRAFLLTVRRSLHRGESIATVSSERLLNLGGLSASDSELVQALVAAAERDRALAQLSVEIENDLALEQDRLLHLSTRIAHESEVAQAILEADDAAEPAHGQIPGRKSLRHRSEHEWRRIARATTVSTPRGWLGHVALLPITTAVAMRSPTVTAQFTAQWMKNVRTQCLACADLPDDWPSAKSPLTVNPLHWEQDEYVVTLALQDNKGPTRVTVRHTELFDRVCTALENGCRTFGELTETLGFAERPEELPILHGFIRHLLELGIVHPSAAPRVRLSLRTTPRQTFANAASIKTGTGGWIDVCREVETGLPSEIARDVQRGVSQALRVLALMKGGEPDRSRWTAATSKRTWSFTEIIGAEIDIGDQPLSNGGSQNDSDDRTIPAWPSTASPKLIRALSARAEHASEIVIDSSFLDECKAPNIGLNWPFDCLVRVPAAGAGYTAVLDSLWPPGKLDARFAETLSHMHGLIPHIEAYRSFLRKLELLTGILFVELLIPPLSDGAANAVRRPIYTRAWTGDPRADAYLPGETDRGRYIPLDTIQIRRVDGRLRAEVDGQPIWPVYHATRTFEPPWERLARILLATAPLDLPLDYDRMNYGLKLLPALLPKHSMVPRISVSEGVVLSPALWRVPSKLLWDKEAPMSLKLRGLIRLRSRSSLPRWLFLLPSDKQASVPCDLESIYAIRTIERCATGSDPLTMVEMVPSPDQFLVMDRAHGSGDRLAAQVQLRLPCDESAYALADRIAPVLLAALDASVALQSGGASPSGCRGPPQSCDRRIADLPRTKKKVNYHE